MMRFKTAALKECISDITLVVWKYIFIDRARRHWFLAILELSFMVVMFYGVWEESPSTFYKTPGSAEVDLKPWDPLDAFPNDSRAIFAYGPSNSFAQTLGHRVAEILHIPEILLPIESAIEKTCTSMVAEQKRITLPNITVRMQQFPYYIDNRIEDNVDSKVSTLSLRWLVGFTLPFCALIIAVTNEAQTGLKDLMWLNGLWKSVYWLGHFLNALFMVLPAIMLILVALFVVPNHEGFTYYTYSDVTLVFAFLFLFSVVSLLHAMVLSVFFSPAWAIAAAVVYWIFTAMFPFIVSNQLTRIDSMHVSRNVKLFTSIFPFMSLHWCFKNVERYEVYRIGAKWTNFYNRMIVREDISIAEVMLLGIISVCVQVIVLWRLETPKTYSVATRFDNFETADDAADELPLIDPDARPLPSVVELQNVTKMTGHCHELNNLSVTTYDKEITVFLGAADSGHNAVLDIMVGKRRPDEGQVLVCSISVISSLEMVQKLVSFCPKYSVSFSDLTFQENLQFFALLRLSYPKARTAVARLISDMNLEPIKNVVVSTLNDSKLRLLNVAIAMVVASEVRVIILQEPTWNMDLETRQDVWEMLLALSRKMSIVMATQDAEEANILGHRIVIMRKGTIVCCGSLAWIREKFGTGYVLHITKGAKYSQRSIEKCIRKHMGVVSMCINDDATAVYILGLVPVPHRIIALLEELEDRTAAIASLSVSVTSLEDIFVRIASGSKIQKPETVDIESPGTPEAIPTPLERSLVLGKEEPHAKFAASLAGKWKVEQIFNVQMGYATFFAVVQCLLHKRFLGWRMRKTAHLYRYFFPVLLVFLSKLLEYLLIRSTPEVPRSSLSYNSSALLRNSHGFIHHAVSNETSFIHDHLEPLMRLDGIHTLWISDNSSLEDIISFNQSTTGPYFNPYQFGVSVSDNLVTLWYSGKGTARTALIITDLYYSSLLRVATGRKEARFQFVHKLDEDQIKQQVTEIKFGRAFRTRLLSEQLFMSFYIPMSACFHSASFVFIPLDERVSKAKLLQLMTGVSGLTYWLTNLMFDAVLEIPTAIIFATVVCFDLVYVSLSEVGVTVLLFFFYALSSTSMAYLFTFLFDNPASCFITVALILFASGVSGTHCVYAQSLVAGWVPDLLLFVGGYFGRLFPSYHLTWGAMKATSMRSGMLVCAQGGDVLDQCCTVPAITFWIPVLGECCTSKALPRVAILSLYYLGSGSHLLFLFLQTLLFIVVLAMLDSSLRQSVASHWGHARPLKYQPELQKSVLKQNVEREAALAKYIVRTHERLEWALVAVDLVQWHPFAPCTAVQDVSLAVRQNECIGILGVPCTSGKNSLLSVLAGESQLVSGEAYMPNLSLLNNLTAWQTRVGYCPQEGGLLPFLTAHDTVVMFARLRGIPVSEAVDVAKLLFGLLDLGNPKQPCGSFSSSDRRKVSLVIAILGSPSVLLLDDPCHGIDPIGRTRIRRLLKSIHECDKMPIIIAMKWAEPDATFLDRVAVMESGKIEAIASIQELSTNFGRGVSITVQVPPRSAEYQVLQREITEAMRRTFRTCELYSCHQGLLTYHVRKVSDKWNVVFKKMIALKSKFHLQDFYVSDMTLQNAFSQLTTRHLYGTGRTGATYSPSIRRASAADI
ncbi:retinal-specific phospholipid-transporting ATPase ABCA4-like isoform X2 [Ornithodoros turicata]|uniref:retinal-specific phospholipid-transporting ATPase ABCA4-like isoform X2 n=1 Tax=Ornithodoros turicata TaxID=34597 RepID=UPI003138FCC6